MIVRDPVVLEFCDKHGEEDAEVLVVRLCRELLTECPTDQGPSPLDVLSSIRNIRGRHSEQILSGAACSGFLVPKNGGYEVIVNAEEPEERQWFSFAHEIVHTFFREVRPHVTEPSAQEELLCDIGAAELTMPFDRFSTEVKDQLLCLELIDHLRDEFEVSFEAAGRRTLTITHESACLFWASFGRTKKQELTDIGDPILRLVSWTSSASWQDKRSYKNRPIIDGSIIAESFLNLDNRVGSGELGIPFDSTVYDIETRAYEYKHRSTGLRRRVAALAKA